PFQPTRRNPRPGGTRRGRYVALEHLSTESFLPNDGIARRVPHPSRKGSRGLRPRIPSLVPCRPSTRRRAVDGRRCGQPSSGRLGSGWCGGRPRAAPGRYYDPANFSSSSKIDNRWFPLIPGTQLTFEGRANRGAGILPHRVVFVVTDLTKVIDGVRTAVMWER